MTVPLIDDDPRRLGDIAIESRIGEGTSAVVLLGRRPDGTAVAVKLLHRHLATAPGVRDLLRREAIALGRVSGTRVARILEVHADAERPYLVTEFIPGESLTQIVERAPLPGTLLSSVLDGVAEALSEIHAAGIVHRDLKPSNIIYGPEGVRVVDFGISVLDDVAGSTRTGTLVGTPAWLSPEQAVGRPVETASDIFNLGMLIVFASTGRNPFGQGRPDAMLYRVVNEPPDLTGVPDRLQPLAAVCLEKDPSARPSLEMVRSALAGARSGSASADRPYDSAAVDANATALGSTTMLGQYAARDVVAAGSPTADHPSRRRRLLIGLAAALAVILAVTGVAVANLIAPFGGSIEVTIDNQSTTNDFLSDPTFRVEVDNGEDGQIAVSDGNSTHRVGTWHPDSTITVSYEPQYAQDQGYEQTWTADELGFNYLTLGQPLQIALTITDDSVRIRMPGGGSGALSVIERGDEKAYIDAQTAEYRTCVSDVKAGWTGELSKFVNATETYSKAVDDNWQGEWHTFLEWGARANAIADDLFVARSEMLTATPPIDSAVAPYSSHVSDARDAVWDAMMDLGTYWDGYAGSLYNAFNLPDGQLNDLFPRDNSLIDLGATRLWNGVNELIAAIESDAAPACRLQYPDAR